VHEEGPIAGASALHEDLSVCGDFPGHRRSETTQPRVTPCTMHRNPNAMPPGYGPINLFALTKRIGQPSQTDQEPRERRGARGSIGRTAPVMVTVGHEWSCGCRARLTGFGGSLTWYPCGTHRPDQEKPPPS